MGIKILLIILISVHSTLIARVIVADQCPDDGCPSWSDTLQSYSYLLITSSPDTIIKRLDNIEIKCCSLEKDTMTVKIAFNSLFMKSNYNYTLVLAELEEKTEHDLAGVTRVPVQSTGYRNSSDAMVTSNFHDIFARHAFPLVDSLTALYTMKLKITVDESSRNYHFDDITVLSNTPISSIANTIIRDSNSRQNVGRRRRTWTFEKSPPMPGSYLAFAIGRFRRNSIKTKRGVEINIWTLFSNNANHLDTTKFALEMASTLTDYYEEEFDYLYPLPKLDIVEAPLDYEAFIVWGLCFVKPGRLQINRSANQSPVQANVGHLLGGSQGPRESVPKKKEIAEVLAHEIAHQWFGSLVSPRTWSDVFLSESFATFYGVEAVRFAKGIPQWMASEAMITALTHRKISLHTDPTIPISSVIMYKNWSRDVQFSTIVYHKGATLLRMLKWVIGEKTFKQGVRKYLRRFQYSTVGANDFLEIFDQVVKEHKIQGWDNKLLDIKAFLGSYIYQPSYPIVNVRVNDTHAVLSQEPFQHQTTTSQRLTLNTNKLLQWYVPITVHLQSKHMKTYWLKPNETLDIRVSDFGFMVRLFHLYVVKPISIRRHSAEDTNDGDSDFEHENLDSLD